MKNNFFSIEMVSVLALSACAWPTGVGTTKPSFSDQVATMIAATMQGLPTNSLVANILRLPLNCFLTPYAILATRIYPILHRSSAWNATVKQ